MPFGEFVLAVPSRGRDGAKWLWHRTITVNLEILHSVFRVDKFLL